MVACILLSYVMSTGYKIIISTQSIYITNRRDIINRKFGGVYHMYMCIIIIITLKVQINFVIVENGVLAML